MAETNSLLNCRTRKGTGGSNPPFSAEKEKNLSVQVYLSKQIFLFLCTGCHWPTVGDYEEIPLSQDAVGRLWVIT